MPTAIGTREELTVAVEAGVQPGERTRTLVVFRIAGFEDFTHRFGDTAIDTMAPLHRTPPAIWHQRLDLLLPPPQRRTLRPDRRPDHPRRTSPRQRCLRSKRLSRPRRNHDRVRHNALAEGDTKPHHYSGFRRPQHRRSRWQANAQDMPGRLRTTSPLTESRGLANQLGRGGQTGHPLPVFGAIGNKSGLTGLCFWLK
jgi:hypothetical protein